MCTVLGMPTTPVNIPATRRLLVAATLHSFATLLAGDPDIPVPDSGTLYAHRLTRAQILAQADLAGSEIKVRDTCAYVTVPLAVKAVHGIDLDLSLFTNDIDADAMDAYGKHNRALAALAEIEKEA